MHRIGRTTKQFVVCRFLFFLHSWNNDSNSSIVSPLNVGIFHLEMFNHSVSTNMTSSNAGSLNYVKCVFNGDIIIRCYVWSLSFLKNFRNITTLSHLAFTQKVIFKATLSFLQFTRFTNVLNHLEIFLFRNDTFATLLIPKEKLIKKF